ncbi:MAG TPA: BamA/TamA family outer membrane protein, partial [Bacteroidia bacterium]|nr:BamA/TamA family outer membrane protein [Bacteroidia bacterium]
LLDFRIKGGVEAQQTIGGEGQEAGQLGFNTIEAGSQVSLNFPRELFPFNLLVTKNVREEQRKTKDRRTVFSASVNYQHRVDYDRSLGNIGYGYTFRYKRYTRFGYYPFELNVVKVNPGSGLDTLLQNGDPFLIYRFTDHLIHDSRVTYNWNNQLSTNTRQRNSFNLSADFETAGMLLRAWSVAANRPQNDLGSYEIAGIPFAQYFRVFTDLRWLIRLGSHQDLAQRVAVGVGFPFGNFKTLPLEKSFYGGGANGIRAWEARSLGPGSYLVPSDQKYSQFGDIRVEYNIELRFDLTRTIELAVFADGGNIWQLYDDPAREGESFRFDKFYNEFAFGPGVGIRYNLGFFVIRLDLAFKFRDPAMPYGERWWVGQRKLGSNLNFGIGYPF